MNTRSVPFFNYPFVFKSQEEQYLAIIKDVGSRGAFIMQKDLHTFEQHLATYTGARYALGVANATDGLHIVLRAGGIVPGDEVIFASHTMVATAAAIHFAGGVPVPVDCSPDHLIDPAAVDAAITRRTKAIMPTQLNGRVCNMDALITIAQKHGLLLFEDAAQALGAKFKGKMAGAFGMGAAISFYPAKTLGCFGDGGAIITNDPGVFRGCVLLHDHGRGDDGEVVTWGLNSRLDNIQAALLDFKLNSYDQEVSRRRALATMYQDRLGDIAELDLPPAPDSDPDHFDVYQNYELEAARRDDLCAFLKERGIGTLVQWGGKAVHQFEKLGLEVTLPYTERMFTRCLMLPMNTALSDDDVAYVCDTIRAFYGYGS